MAAKLYLSLMLILLGTITVQGARKNGKKMNPLHSYLMQNRRYTDGECRFLYHGSDCMMLVLF